MAGVVSQTLSRRARGLGGVRLGAALVLIMGAVAADAQESRRPNIVFVLSDDHNHSVLGIAGNPAVRSARPAHRLDLHLRRHLPEGRQGCRIDPALVQHGNDEPAACGHFG